jgi:hypothetical protein
MLRSVADVALAAVRRTAAPPGDDGLTEAQAAIDKQAEESHGE